MNGYDWANTKEISRDTIARKTAWISGQKHFVCVCGLGLGMAFENAIEYKAEWKSFHSLNMCGKKDWIEQNYKRQEIGMQFRSTEAILIWQKQSIWRTHESTKIWREKPDRLHYTSIAKRALLFCEKWQKKKEKLNQNWNRFAARLHCLNAVKLLLL